MVYHRLPLLDDILIGLCYFKWGYYTQAYVLIRLINCI